ncbi:MAG: hypothetical protein H7248_01150 [Microbacteriaceae bacterium]|nr:hypothetical protein [Microbacteriaceae bacterium]
MIVYGQTIDDQTRCVHYGSAQDVIAIKFACCERYYPCFSCHAEAADHAATTWPRELWLGQKAILCGVCSTEHTIADYRSVQSCPHCAAPFNPGCQLHWHLYFEG